jgi:hypothetical protein
MVNTVKFSQFATAPLTSANTEVVGLESGVNVQSTRFLSWTTAGRPATPFNGLLGINTTLEAYEYWDSVTAAWVQLIDTHFFALLASHLVGEGASLIGLQNQSNVTNKTVQDLANASFIAKTDNGTLQNAQFLGSLTTGIVKNTTSTGVLSISAPLTSIDGLVTAANEMLYTTGANTYAVTVLTSFSRGLFVNADAASWRAALGVTPGGGTITSISSGTGITLTPDPIIATGSVALTIPVVVTSGGTGLTSVVLGDILYASAANTLSALAGNITTAKQYLSQTGTGAVSDAPAWATIAGGDITGAALSKTDDTNVTLTLGGTPTTALLRAASLTLGWTGQLSLARGGSNASLVASNGGIVYSTATAMAILAGTATAQQMLQSGASGAPAWSTATWPATASTSGNVLTSDGTNWTSAAPAASATSVIVDDTTTNATMFPVWVTANTGSLPLKVSSTKLAFNPSTGTLVLVGDLKSVTQITDANAIPMLVFTPNASAVNYIGMTNQIAANAPSFYTIGSDAAINLLLQIKNGNLQVTDLTGTIAPAIQLYNAARTQYTGLKVATAAAATITFTLPSADATVSGQAMISNASGVLSFSSTPISTAPVRTVLTSGSGNYTTAANVLWLEVEVIGGGAGGGSSGTAGQASGTAGNASSFGTLTANGGSAGSSYYSGGIGGTASGGDINIPGGSGNPGSQIGTLVAGQVGGGNGGNSALGGSGTGGGIGKVAGSVGGTNSGGGGGGGSTDTTSASVSGGGGGAGGYAKKIISPTAGQVFAYAVGAAANGASAGTDGAAGGNGAAGIIIVTAHYQ